MSRKKEENETLNAEDQKLWDLMMRDVVPLRPSPASPPAGKSGQSGPKTVVATKAPAPAAQRPIPASSQHPGAYEVDKSTHRKLKRGHMAIEARLDLHGLSQARAYEELKRFLIGAHHQGLRCLLVITGKGRNLIGDQRSDERAPGVIKRSLPLWLEEPDLKGMILKTESAHIKDGGAGAFYILLRRKN